MAYFKTRMHKIRFRLELCPRPRWGSLQRSPRTLARFKGPTSRGGEGRGGSREKREREKGSMPGSFSTNISLWLVWYGSVAAISSERWGDGGLGAEPLVRGSGGRSPPEVEKKLNFDNTKTPLIFHQPKCWGRCPPRSPYNRRTWFGWWVYLRKR